MTRSLNLQSLLSLWCLAWILLSCFEAVCHGQEAAPQKLDLHDLESMTQAELELICIERGFELIQDDESGELLTHADYVDAARRCLAIEEDMNEILEQNPELAEELLSEIEKMKNEKEKLVAEHQRMLKEKEDLEQQLLDKVKDGGEGSTVSKTSATATGVSSGAWGTGEATSSSLSMPPSASGSHQPPDDSVPSKTSATATGVSGGSWGAGEATSPPVPMSSSASGSPQLKNDSAPSKTSATATGVSGGSWGAGEATSPPVSMSSSSTGSPPPQDGSEPFKTSATATGESGDSLNAGQGTTSPVSTSALSSAPASTDDDAQFEADTECFENNAIEPSSTETATTRKSDGSSTATDFSLRGFLQEVMKEFEKDIGRITGLLLPVITPMLEAGNFAWKHAKVLFRGIKHQWEKYQSSQKEAAQQGGKEGGDESVPSQASKTSDVA